MVTESEVMSSVNGGDPELNLKVTDLGLIYSDNGSPCRGRDDPYALVTRSPRVDGGCIGNLGYRGNESVREPDVLPAMGS